MVQYLYFHRAMTVLDGLPVLPSGLTLERWRPSLGQWLPSGFPAIPFLVWTLFHFLRVFATREYGLVLIRQGARIVHRTCILPGHYKFPFMGPGDLQTAGIWTDPALRGAGLGLVAMGECLRWLEDSRCTLWYVVRDDNLASLRLAEKCGFRLVGVGLRTRRLGSHKFGVFQIRERCPASGAGPPPPRPDRGRAAAEAP
jgi:RimJ/RimL family protein N-acetyltransferase